MDSPFIIDVEPDSKRRRDNKKNERSNEKHKTYSLGSLSPPPISLLEEDHFGLLDEFQMPALHCCIPIKRGTIVLPVRSPYLKFKPSLTLKGIEKRRSEFLSSGFSIDYMDALYWISRMDLIHYKYQTAIHLHGDQYIEADSPSCSHIVFTLPTLPPLEFLSLNKFTEIEPYLDFVRHQCISKIKFDHTLWLGLTIDFAKIKSII